MILIEVVECHPESPKHQVLININGLFFWLQVPASDKATADQIAEQVKKTISTEVARMAPVIEKLKDP